MHNSRSVDSLLPPSTCSSGCYSARSSASRSVSLNLPKISMKTKDIEPEACKRRAVWGTHMDPLEVRTVARCGEKKEVVDKMRKDWREKLQTYNQSLAWQTQVIRSCLTDVQCGLPRTGVVCVDVVRCLPLSERVVSE